MGSAVKYKPDFYSNIPNLQDGSGVVYSDAGSSKVLLEEGSTYLIYYQNAREEKTKRTIHIHNIYHGRNGHTYIRAYCSLRQEMRTFREDRIEVVSEAGPAETADFRQIPAVKQPIPLHYEEKKKEKKRGGRAFGRIAVAAMALFLFSRSPAFDEIMKSLQNTSDGNTDSTVLIDQNLDAHNTNSHSSGTSTSKTNKKTAHKKTAQLYIEPLTLQDLNKLFDKIDDDKEFNALMNSYFKQLLKQSDLFKDYKLLEVSTLIKAVSSPAYKKFNSGDMKKIFGSEIGYFKYRGVTIKITEEYGVKSYIVPAYNLLAVSTTGIKEQINAALFEKTTGIYDPYLDSIYACADKNNDFKLSWGEIQGFQNSLYHSYKYLNNRKALRPDEFISKGGGDCEDWALMTSGLLTYWGYKSYIGVFAPSSNRTAHAICFLYTTLKPPDIYSSIHLTDTDIGIYKESNRNVQPGYYTPIDYTVVGGYSKAMGRNWRLVNIDNPKDIYDAPL